MCFHISALCLTIRHNIIRWKKKWVILMDGLMDPDKRGCEQERKKLWRKADWLTTGEIQIQPERW